MKSWLDFFKRKAEPKHLIVEVDKTVCASGRINLLEGEGEPKPLARTPITRDNKRDLSPGRQERMRDIARHLWRSNPVAKRGIQNLRSFVTSEGFAIRATAQDEDKRARVQRFLDIWWRANRWELKLKQRIETLSVDGELFFWIAPPDLRGLRKLCYILPENIKEVHRDPLDSERMHKVVLQKPLEFEYQGLKHSKRELTIADEDHLEAECLVLQINALSGQTRGFSDLLVVADNLDRVDALLDTEGERIQFQRSYAWFVEVDTDSEEKVLATRDNLNKLGPPGPGSIHVHSSSEQWDPKSPKLHLEDSVEFIKLVLILCFGGLYMPEHYFASGGDVNKATSQQMDTPIFTLTRDRKKDTKAWIGLGAEIALRAFAAAGSFVGFSEADLAFEVVSRDPDRSAYDLIGDMLNRLGESLKLGVAEGFISDTEAARAFRLAASGLGLGEFPGVDEDSLSKARDRAEKMLERDRERLQGQCPLALPRESQSPLDDLEIRAAEEDEKKKTEDQLIAIQHRRSDVFQREIEATAQHVEDRYRHVSQEILMSPGIAIDLDYIRGNLEGWQEEFRKGFPKSDWRNVADSARDWVDTTLKPFDVQVGHDMEFLRPDGSTDSWSWHRRVGNITIREPDLGQSRTAGGRRRSLDRMNDSWSLFGARDFGQELLKQAEEAKAKGWTKAQLAGALATDPSVPGATSDKLRKKIAANMEFYQRQVYDRAERMALADYAEAFPGAIRRTFVRVKNYTGPCKKCDPKHGLSFTIVNSPRLPLHPHCGCAYVTEFNGQQMISIDALSERLGAVMPKVPPKHFEPYKDRRGYLDSLLEAPEHVQAPVVFRDEYTAPPGDKLDEEIMAALNTKGHLQWKQRKIPISTKENDLFAKWAGDYDAVEARERAKLLSAAASCLESPDFWYNARKDKTKRVFVRAMKLGPEQDATMMAVVLGRSRPSDEQWRVVTWYEPDKDEKARINEKLWKR